MATNLPNIFDYNDFRKYLADHQTARQALDPSFTKSSICKLMGLPNTRSYFNDVINGKEVTKTFLDRFVIVLNLDAEEARFFRVLVQLNQATNPDEREMFFDQLISLNRTPKRIIDESKYAYYSEWYHGAIRALLAMYDYTDDHTALARKLFPPITPKKAKQSIELLIELGLARADARGFIKPVDKSIVTDPAMKTELLKNYQLKCLELAQHALLANQSQYQDITTNMISISEDGLKRLDKKIQKFRAEVRSLVHKDEKPADRLYLLNMQLIPTSKVSGS